MNGPRLLENTADGFKPSALAVRLCIMNDFWSNPFLPIFFGI